jgi:hypothetical protein
MRGIRKIAVGSNGDNQPRLPDISFAGHFHSRGISILAGDEILLLILGAC